MVIVTAIEIDLSKRTLHHNIKGYIGDNKVCWYIIKKADRRQTTLFGHPASDPTQTLIAYSASALSSHPADKCDRTGLGIGLVNVRKAYANALAFDRI